jgi:predicted dehydrogenase
VTPEGHTSLAPIAWGVLGTGMIATTRMMPAIAAAPSASLAALASRDLGRARQAAASAGALRGHGSYDDLLDDPEIDVVYVALPNQLHVEWAARALEAGKHVLCEKPLGLLVSELVGLREVRDRTGRHVEEALAFRNHPQWETIDELLRTDAIGRVTGVQATLARRFMNPEDIRNNPAAGGGALYDLGPYVVSACNAILGRAPGRVVAAIDTDPAFGIDRLSTALLDYGDAHATLTMGTQSGTAAWGTHQTLSILGTEGWLRCDFPYAHARPTSSHVFVGDLTSVGSFETRTVTFEPVDHYALQVERFSRLVRGEDVPSWPLEDALTTLETIRALFASARGGGWEELASRWTRLPAR